MSYQNRVVIVTGASSGAGRALAMQLAHQGANVILADCNVLGMQRLTREITWHLEEKLGNLIAVLADTDDEEQLALLLALGDYLFGDVDTIIDAGKTLAWDKVQNTYQQHAM